MNTQKLHIAYLPPSGNWLRSIMTRLHKSSSTILRDRMNSWGGTPLREIGLALSTKEAMLFQVVVRFDEQFNLLAKNLMENQRTVLECLDKGASYVIPETLLPYKMLVYIDSFLFESRSIYEIFGKFLVEFHDHILQQKVTEDDIKGHLAKKGIDIRWIEELRKNRILFFHNTAPWIAIEIETIEPLKFHLLVLKRDVHDLNKIDEYIHMDQLRNVYNGFRSSITAIHDWILNKISNYEKTEKA